jgi:hypothetical protein
MMIFDLYRLIAERGRDGHMSRFGPLIRYVYLIGSKEQLWWPPGLLFGKQSSQ